ncbi:MAG: hypothetical protein WBH85_11915 [Thermoanaerobaculia bacterium]
MPAKRTKPVTRLSFPLSAELRQQTLETIAQLRESTDRRRHLPLLSDLISDLTEAGLEYYFVHSLQRAGVGMIGVSTAKLGIASTSKGIPMVINNVVKMMSDEQLAAVADFIEEALIEEPRTRKR